MQLQDLPGVNATFNALATVCIGLGLRAIRKKDIESHKRWMLSAVACSTLFLVGYLTYHFQKGGVVTKFPEEYPTARLIYLAILLTHTVLAAFVPFLVGRTLYLAFKDRREAHKKIARVTVPIWRYVSFTGVVIYAMLYHWFRPR